MKDFFHMQQNMFFQVANDIHLEFYYNAERKVTRTIQRIPKLADTILLAGDIHVPHWKYTDEIFSEFTRIWEKVLYIPGNHDYWYFEPRKKHNDTVPKLASARLEWFIGLEKKFNNLSVLRTGHIVEHEGIRFLGDTMWFPDLPLNVGLKSQMNDFDKIPGFEPWVYERNTGFVNWIKSELRKGDVVMTHHLPSYSCVHPYNRFDRMNPFYVTDLSNVISFQEPAVWVHGHNHEWEDQMLGSTRVVSCPKGYPSYLVKGFDKGLLVEVK